MSRPRLIALFLVLVTLMAYLPVARHDFVTYDDNDYVANNHIVQNGLTLAGVEWAFSTRFDSNWHPVTWLSHMADCSLFGLNAGAHHFVNVLFHAANAALLFVLLWRLTQRLWPSALVAALFAWHPLHVESVAWISERKDVLSTFFALLAMLSYAKYVKENCRRSFWFALVFFALGLMSKPMLVTLPFVLLLLDYWPLERMRNAEGGTRNYQRLFVEKILFLALSAVSCVVTFLVQRSGEAVVTLQNVSLQFRLVNAPVAAWRYLLKIFWPTDLAVIYPLASQPPVTFGLAVVVLLLISAGAWRWRKTRPYFLVGWLWFLGTLVPVIGLVQVGSAAMADRYTYIPAIGIFIALAFGLHEFGEWRRWPKAVFPAVSVAISVVCLGLAERQLAYWRDSEALFRHALAVTKNNEVAHGNLGYVLELEDRPAEALTEYREALSLNPTRNMVHFSIGKMLDELGQPAEALAEYRQLLRLKPEVPALHNAAGESMVALGKLDEALAEFGQAAQLDRHYSAPHVGAAKALLLQGHDHAALDELQAAQRIDPDSFEILAYTAHILAADENAAARDGQTALVLAHKADDLTAGSQPLVVDILGMAYAETGDFTNAVTSAQNALELAETAKLKNREAIRQRLELYKNRQPWRESFLATNAPLKQ
jgi:tetratricopeptide (TPR) repeat protein